jgi:hypothetical protein
MDTEEQKDIFNMFHDGCFTHFCQVDNDLHFEVDIEYLAQMLHPAYHRFKGILKNCQRLALKFWDDEEIIEDRNRINELVDELEIANAENNPDGVSIYCHRYGRLPDNRYGSLPGGELSIVCDAISLFDEAGQAMSVDDLRTICQNYWQDFGKR